MNDVLSQPWAIWALGVAIALPLLLVVLGELSARLASRHSPFVRPVQVLRIAVVPLGALLLLLRRAAQLSDNDAVRILETCFTIAVVVDVLLLLDACLAAFAARQTHRRRIPGIFVDLVRVLLVICGVFLVLATVWTYPVEHFLTALGVTSIVIGIALQSAVGNIISGLLLLSERPFSIGDWIQVGTLTGRVNEINWRAVHLDTGSSLQVVPNGMLATSTFANFNRPIRAFQVVTALHFSIEDPPDRVRAMLDGVASSLPDILAGSSPATEITDASGGVCSYETTFMVTSYDQSKRARTSFVERVWFAARREGFAMAGMAAPNVVDEATTALHSTATLLRLVDEDIAALAPRVRVERFAPGEVIQRQGEQSTALHLILDGVARGEATIAGQSQPHITELRRNDAFGSSAMTRQPALSTITAVDNLKVLTIPTDVLDSLLDQKPLLANDLGQMMDRLRVLLTGSPSAVAGNGRMRDAG